MKALSPRRDLHAVAILLLTYSLAIVAMSATRDPTQWGAADAELFHLPQINWFIEWGVHLDYPSWSATAPGFHWMMATLARLSGAEALDQGSWQSIAVPACLTGAGLLLFYAALRSGGATPGRALLFAFPLVTSSYFWTPALHPVSECLSMVGLFAMAYALSRRARRPLVFGIAAAIATIARQNFLSVAGAFCLMDLVGKWPRIINWRMAGRMALSLGPSLLVIIALVTQWGGLTPPEWQEVHVGFSLGPALHGLMLLGIFGWLFLRPEDLSDDPRTQIRAVVVIFLLAFVLWLAIPENGGDRPYSVVWQAAGRLPTIQRRPILTLPLLACGMVVIWAYWKRGLRDGYGLSPELSLFACYFVGQSAQNFSWQRYAEVPVLLLLCLGMARTRNTNRKQDILMLAAFSAYFVLTALRMTD